jgi:hypothetical protein
LILLGDVIHGYGPPEEDYSLHLLFDIMRLQADLGPGVVMMLLGNHELPHIYGVPLSKGDLTFTPRFEHALGEYRVQVIEFLKTLPFMVRTAGGVLLTHAGAAVSTAAPEAADRLLSFSHDALLREVDRLLERQDIGDLLAAYQRTTEEEYAQMAWEYLAVTGPEDPRYLDLLRGFVVSGLEPEWPLLWDFFFTQCEAGYGALMYGKILERFLRLYSTAEMPQRVMVTGHIPVRNGYTIVADRQLRLASYAHAQPRQSGRYLLFDVARPVEKAANLEPFIFPMPH